MPRTEKWVIGIDPDVDKSGFAVLRPAERKITVAALTFPEIVCRELQTLSGLVKAQESVVVVVEASWMVQANWHLAQWERKRRAAAMGYDVGRNHQVGKAIVEVCKHLGIPVVEHIPLRKCWKGKDRKITHEELIQFCPVDKTRTNQEMRDAALLAWCYADLPIIMKPLKSKG